MNNIKIETLTAVHIGSGEALCNGSDFIKDNEEFIGIIDIDKLAQTIGLDNIDKFISAVERKEHIGNIIKTYAPKATIEDYTSRQIIFENSLNIKPNETLKELIHNGCGIPYIPGSSIKGAIRTAIVATCATDSGVSLSDTKNFKGNITGDKKEALLFSNNPKRPEQIDPYTDLFRFLQIGDAYFGDNYTLALKMVNINERSRQSYWDESKPQIIEVLSPDDESSFKINLNLNANKMAQHTLKKLPECMSSIENILHCVNTHTISLLESEMTHWEKLNQNGNADGVEKYIKAIQNILITANSCKAGFECVLRIGHGSGWRFITGAWTEKLSNFKTEIVPKARPRNNNYTQYDFPKTRRVDSNCELLGFVKLSLIK